MEEELCRLRSQVELHRMQTTVIATLEGERAALERDRDTLRSTMDAMRNAQRKVDEYTCPNTHTHTHTCKHLSFSPHCISHHSSCCIYPQSIFK